MNISRYIYIPFLIAIAYTLIYTLFGGLSGSFLIDFIMGVVFGFSLILYNDFKVRKIDADGDKGVYEVRPSRKLVLFTNYENVFDLCLESVKILGKGAIINQDRENGVIIARQGMNWLTGGNKITYNVKKITEVTTEIELKSAPSIGIAVVDYGEGWQALKRISNFLDEKNKEMNQKYIIENKNIPTEFYVSQETKEKVKETR